jgi:hypothetical protein
LSDACEGGIVKDAMEIMVKTGEKAEEGGFLP